MLKYNVLNLMRVRGVVHPYAFLVKNGFTRGVAQRIAGGKMVAISPWNVERLCVVLKCLPSDLYCWTADKGEDDTESNPLWKIREQAVKSVADVGKGISAERMGEFLDAVKVVEEKYKG
jgi:hypothetical protein